MFKVTKEFKFCAAHRLYNYEGDCHNLHGHNYKALVTIGRQTLFADSSMVIDFRELKNNIGLRITNFFDHAILLNEKDEELVAALKKFKKTRETNLPMKMFLFNGDPTAENIAKTIHDEIGHLQFLNISYYIYKVVIYETETSYAEYSEYENV